MRRLAAVIAVGTVLLMAASSAMALGLGRVRTSSYLGDPLDLSIAISAESSDALSPECIKAEVYSGDSRVPDEMVRLRIERTGSGAPTSLRVVTGSRIDEPLARLDLTLSCGTTLSRRYVVFVDPPVLDMAATAAPNVESTTSSARGEDSAPPTRPRRSRAAGREARRAAAGVQSGGSGGVVTSAARSHPQRRTTRAASAPVSPRNEPGSRLQLESAPLTAAASPVTRPGSNDAGQAGAASSKVAAASLGAAGPAAAATNAGNSAASAAVGGLLDQLAAKADAGAAERVRALEADLARLRGTNQSLQKSVTDLERQLGQARGASSSGLLIYGLAGVVVLLLLVLAALAWQRRRQRQDSDWLAGAAPADGGFDDEPRLRASERAFDGDDGASARTLDGTADAPAVDAATTGQRLPTAVAAIAPHEATAVHDPRREVSVEELIDLEQQADFFVVLGQEEAAIDLLLGHVQGTGGASPLPYLKLLEIHRRREEREAYDRVRERFNRRFGALAPDWESHSGHHRALEDYPSVVAQLQRAWAQPALAMQVLSTLLFKRDDDGQTFDLPAYAELLFLYSMARDLAEHEEPEGGVDLLLPLDESAAARTGAASASSGASSEGSRSPAEIGLPTLRLDSLHDAFNDSSTQRAASGNPSSGALPPRPSRPAAASPPESGWSFDLQLDEDFNAPKPTSPSQRPGGKS